MKTKVMSVGLLVLVLGLGVQAAIYDDFNGESGTWAGPSGTSPNGKWTYSYGAATAGLVESGGTLQFDENSGGGHSIKSTQTWAMPTNENESLTFKFKISNANYGDRGSIAHYINFLGDATNMAVAGGWQYSGDWSFMEKPAWGWNDTGITVPANNVWDTVTVKYYRTTSDLRWQIQIERPGMATYTTDRTLYWGFGNTEVGLQMNSDWGKVQYDYVDVTYVPEPATMTLLGLGFVGLLRRKN